MIWLSFFGPRKPINGQDIYFYGESFGVRKGTYKYLPEDIYETHFIASRECAGACDRMSAPYWMPDVGQPRPEKPETPYPKDYPHLEFDEEKWRKNNE